MARSRESEPVTIEKADPIVRAVAAIYAVEECGHQSWEAMHPEDQDVCLETVVAILRIYAGVLS